MPVTSQQPLFVKCPFIFLLDGSLFVMESALFSWQYIWLEYFSFDLKFMPLYILFDKWHPLGHKSGCLVPF